MLNFMGFSQAYFSRVSRSLWKVSLPSNILTVPLSLVLSANLLRMHSIPLHR